MDKKAFQERAARLAEVNAVIAKLDPAIRAGAYEALSDYVTGRAPAREQGKGAAAPPPPPPPPDDHRGGGDDNELFTSHDHDKPADNVKLIAADHFRKYGSVTFTSDEVRQVANDVGLTVPERLDMTLLSAKSGGKNLFTRAGRGEFKPTVHGEKYLKDTYDVKKGTKAKPGTEAE